MLVSRTWWRDAANGPNLGLSLDVKIIENRADCRHNWRPCRPRNDELRTGHVFDMTSLDGAASSLSKHSLSKLPLLAIR
jgi:hypothetical protein